MKAARRPSTSPSSSLFDVKDALWLNNETGDAPEPSSFMYPFIRSPKSMLSLASFEEVSFSGKSASLSDSIHSSFSSFVLASRSDSTNLADMPSLNPKTPSTFEADVAQMTVTIARLRESLPHSSFRCPLNAALVPPWYVSSLLIKSCTLERTFGLSSKAAARITAANRSI
jgi:hypothetical protein